MTSKYFSKLKARRPHLVRPGGGISGEVNDLRNDVDDAFEALEANSIAALMVDIADAQAGDADGIMTAQASAATAQVFTATNFDGLLAPGTGPAIIRCPKRIQIVIAGATPAHFLGGTVTLVGKDADGLAQTEALTVAAGAGTTNGTKFFSELSSASFPASSGTGATIQLGVTAQTDCIANGTSGVDGVDLNIDSEFNRNRIGNRVMPVARAVALVLSSSTDFNAGSMTVYGEDSNGDAINEVLTIPDNGNTTVNGTKFFKRITRVVKTGGDAGGGGTWQLGIRDAILGLPRKMANGAMAAVGVKEASRADTATAWTAPTAGTLTAPASALPNGSYTPNSAPDGARGYILAYLPEA